MNTAGVRDSLNADWSESHRTKTIASNVSEPIIVANSCHVRGIDVTHFGPDCIYGFDDEHPEGGQSNLETDPPNFSSTMFNGCYYAFSKEMSEKAREANKVVKH